MLVFHRTLAHLSTSGSSSSSPSLLAFLRKSRGPPPVWVPSIVPPHLVPFYQRACTTYDAVGSTTALVQSVAVLEVLHSRFRLVRSPLQMTVMQVAGRLFSVWFVAARFLSVRRFSLP
jgi:very-long-chain (3R)-3-hydroxyacyl-CoA dehydratase